MHINKLSAKSDSTWLTCKRKREEERGKGLVAERLYPCDNPPRTNSLFLKYTKVALYMHSVKSLCADCCTLNEWNHWRKIKTEKKNEIKDPPHLRPRSSSIIHPSINPGLKTHHQTHGGMLGVLRPHTHSAKMQTLWWDFRQRPLQEYSVIYWQREIWLEQAEQTSFGAGITNKCAVTPQRGTCTCILASSRTRDFWELATALSCCG